MTEQSETMSRIFNKRLLDSLMNKDKRTQEEVAKEIGMNAATLSLLRTGRNQSPQNVTVQKLVKFFNLPIEDFWVEETVKSSTSKPKAVQKKAGSSVKPSEGSTSLKELVQYGRLTESEQSKMSGSAQVVNTFADGSLCVKFNGEFYQAVKM